MNLCRNPYFNEKLGISHDCGSCRSCRLKRRGEWAMRLAHEASTHNNQTLFVTLTYNAANLPKNGSLSIIHCQKFFKRLRRRLEKRGDPVKFKYYLCGEYGPKTCRPHYHVVILGLSMSYADDIYKAWGLCDAPGFKCEPVLSDKAFKYVAGYASKKLGVRYNSKFIEKYSKIPEFQLQSHGIGRSYITSIADYVKKKLTIRFKGKDRVPPRYYRNILGLTAEDYKDKIQAYLNELNDKVLIVKKSFLCSYTEAMELLRRECDLRIKKREEKWRISCAATL